MTGELIPAGSPLRVLPSEIGSVIPVVDIADMIGYNRSSITKTIDKNEAAFEGLKTFQTLPTSGGNQRFLCLNHTGTERLFLLLSPSSKTKKDLFVKVEQFRLRAFGKMEESKEIVPAPRQPTGPDLDTEIKHARTLAEKCGKNPDVFLAIALEKCGDGDYARALQAPAVVHGEPGWYNVTQLVALCNDTLLNPERLNYYLMNRGFQYRDENRLWRLTPAGMGHGKEYLYTSPHQHSEIRISWRESVLYASGLKRPLASDQAALPAMAGVR